MLIGRCGVHIPFFLACRVDKVRLLCLGAPMCRTQRGAKERGNTTIDVTDFGEKYKNLFYTLTDLTLVTNNRFCAVSYLTYS